MAKRFSLSSRSARTVMERWGRGGSSEPKTQELFLRDVAHVRDELRDTGQKVLENPKSIEPIEYRGGSLVPQSARTGGVMIFAPSRWGKSRLEGRGVCYSDLEQLVPTVVIDRMGATIDNLLDTVLYLPKPEQLAALERIKYCNMAGEHSNGQTYVTSWPMLEKRTADEALYTTSQRYIDLVAKTERYFATAPIMGFPRFANILTNISLVLGAANLPISSAFDLLDQPEEWQAHLQQLRNHPEVGFAAQDLLAFFKEKPQTRAQYVEPLKNRLSFLRHDRVSREMFAGGNKPTIDWSEVLSNGQTVLLDFRQHEPETLKQLKLFWVWEALREVISNRKRSDSPLSLVIDELAFFVHGTDVNKDKISQDFHELIQVQKGNANVWLTLATQNQEQLPDELRIACLQIASQIFGAVQDLESAGELADRWYVKDPNRVKHWRNVWVTERYGDARSGEWYQHFVIDQEPEFSPLDEQQYMNSRKFIDQAKGHGLFAQSQYEGHIPQELLPISMNNFDRGEDGKLRYINEELVGECRRRLMKRDGIPVSQVLAEPNHTTGHPPLLQDIAAFQQGELSENGQAPQEDMERHRSGSAQ